MARGATMKTEDDGASDTKPNKRRCVQSACVPCRKRKSKCDGGTPVCATCTAVYKTECFYDEPKDGSRARTTTAAVKREHPGASDNAEFLVKTIRSLPESEAHELIQQIRRDPRLDIPALAETWRKTVALPPSSATEHASLESDLSLLMGKPATTQTGESRHFGHTSSMGLVPEDENYTASAAREPVERYAHGTWTKVTDDIEFVQRLLDLYFKWSHPFYTIFPRQSFEKDFHTGRQKYCSPLLVNAILAYGCHFTDEPAGRTDPDNFRTAGDHFFAEARRLLYEDETPSLTTIQALCVMAMREPSAGRDSSGYMYIGRCMRMAIEFGLHLNTSNAPNLQLTASEREVRKVTFWGCFVVDTVWSLCIGRISQLPRAAITLDKPLLEETPAKSYVLNQPNPEPAQKFLQEFSTLSELVNDNIFLFYAPKERFTSRRVLDMYSKYKSWYANLPAQLRLPENPEVPAYPHIIVLHMLYHTLIVHLFRPLLKVDIIHSEIRPRDTCVESANNVTDLFRRYRMHYDLRACHLILTHILLSVSVVHLIETRLESRNHSMSSRNLVYCLQGLEDLSICHYFGARSFKIVHSLAKTWNLPWPDALKLSKLVPKEDAPLASPPTSSFFQVRSTPNLAETVNGYSTIPPSMIPTRRESLSMFAHGPSNMSLSPHDSAALVEQRLPSSLPFTGPGTAATAPSTTTDYAGALFWTPTGDGVPIIHRNYGPSPMDLHNLVDTSTGSEWDPSLNRDGFIKNDAWTQGTVGFTSHPIEGRSNFATQTGQLAPAGPGYEPYWDEHRDPGSGVR